MPPATATLGVRAPNKFEAMKAARDGLEALADIERYAAAATPVAEIPEPDLQRMKWYGVFYRPQTPDEFMMRLRLPGGVMTSRQARGIARLFSLPCKPVRRRVRAAAAPRY